MTWWHFYSAARVLFIAQSPDVHHDSVHHYLQAARRIERGEYGEFDHVGQSISVRISDGDGFTPEAPIASWKSHIPPRLFATIAASRDLPMAPFRTVPFMGGNVSIHVPQILATPLTLPPSAILDAFTVGIDWRLLFPGPLLAEAIPQRHQLRTVIAMAASDLPRAQSTAETMVRERVHAVRCPNEEPLWRLLAAEDENEALAKAQDELGVNARSWDELRHDARFRASIAKPLSALVAAGWLGVLWLQLYVDLRGRAERGPCRYPGCDQPIGLLARLYCEHHAVIAKREASAKRTRRARGLQ